MIISNAEFIILRMAPAKSESCFSHFVSGKPDNPATVSLEAKKDKELEDILTKLNMLSLYDVFENNNITTEVIWELNDDDLRHLGLFVADRVKYKRAKEQVKGR